MTLPVAILAGGLATRLGPLAREVPKSLIEVAGEPFVAHQLRRLRENGIGRVVLCVGHLGELIRERVGDGAALGLRVDYSFDGPRLLGTGGALVSALPLLGEAFFVLYGDSYLECDYRAVEESFRAAGRLALMTVYRNEDRWDRSNAELVEGRIVRYDKRRPSPNLRHIDYGLGVLAARVLDGVLPDQPSDLADVYCSLAERGELAGFEVAERFYEIGSLAGLEETRRHLEVESRKSKVES